jgi:hypothetical protein
MCCAKALKEWFAGVVGVVIMRARY